MIFVHNEVQISRLLMSSRIESFAKSVVNPVTENLETSNLEDVQQHTAFSYESQCKILCVSLSWHVDIKKSCKER